ncbi:MAG: DUF6153 family protein [Pseudonocardia sp.]|nr:DUF6153 family protein [Pseudonocardia sp.]
MNLDGHLDKQRLLLLAMLVAGLLAGLVGTHHMPVEQPRTSAAMRVGQHGDQTPAPARHDDHNSGDHSALVHLCVAILAAGALIVLTMMMWRMPVVVLRVAPARTSRARSTPRAPPATAPDRLALLCVLRT